MIFLNKIKIKRIPIFFFIILSIKNKFKFIKKLRKRILLNLKMLLNHIGLILKVRITITSNL